MVHCDGMAQFKEAMNKKETSMADAEVQPSREEEGAGAGRSLRSVVRAKVEIKPPSFGGKPAEDIRRFWKDWRRYTGLSNDGRGMLARDQLEQLLSLSSS